jgi:hypothetical protein
MEMHPRRLFISLLELFLLLVPSACRSVIAQPPPVTGERAQARLQVTIPAEHFGHAVGADFKLPDWQQVSSYYRLLAEQSPCVTLETLGKTTEGRDFLLAVISSPANLANLDAIRAKAKVIADPRGRTQQQKDDAIGQGKVILFISPAMHSTETAGSQFGLEFAHTLATSSQEPWKSARDNLVVCIFPCTNPDGLDHVSHWYRDTHDTPFEAAEMLKLYQFYSGHDNNRDWFMLTQAETRLVTEQLYARWFPQVYWDVHQQGTRAERMFIPPFRDPLNPNLDPAVIAGIDALCSRAMLDMTRDGLTGVASGVTFDMWWNGGNRNVPVRHNIIGLLTEAASVRVASPLYWSQRELRGPADIEGGYIPSNQFPAPWPGGWWRMRDIIDYEMSFGRSLLASISREPQVWLRNCMEAAQRSIDQSEDGAPRAWIIPSDNRDPAAVKRLVDVLLRSGVEMHVSEGAIDADGRTYPGGSIVIHRAQPYGSHVKDLFEVQRYPGGKPPYDVAGWTLPYLLGVRRVEVMQSLAEAPLRQASTIDAATAAFKGDERLASRASSHLSLLHSDCWQTIVERLQRGETLSLLVDGEDEGLIAVGDAAASVEADRKRVVSRMPRIGVFSPWEGDMDEGWLRYAFDSSGVPFVSVRNEMLRAGELDAFIDVLIVPSIGAATLDDGRPPGSIPEEYARGLAPEGAVAVEEFVRGGGTLIALGASTQWAIDLFQLPVVDVTRLPDNREFSCPGSVLRTVPDDGAALTAGLADSISVFFSGSGALRLMTEQERKDARRPNKDEQPAMQTLLRYASTRVLLSGWINKPEVIENQTAWLRTEHGRGRVHLFAFRPQYRGWSQGTFQLIFRAAIFDTPQPQPQPVQ